MPTAPVAPHASDGVCDLPPFLRRGRREPGFNIPSSARILPPWPAPRSTTRLMPPAPASCAASAPTRPISPAPSRSAPPRSIAGCSRTRASPPPWRQAAPKPRPSSGRHCTSAPPATRSPQNGSSGATPASPSSRATGSAFSPIPGPRSAGFASAVRRAGPSLIGAHGLTAHRSEST